MHVFVKMWGKRRSKLCRCCTWKLLTKWMSRFYKLKVEWRDVTFYTESPVCIHCMLEYTDSHMAGCWEPVLSDCILLRSCKLTDTNNLTLRSVHTGNGRRLTTWQRDTLVAASQLCGVVTAGAQDTARRSTTSIAISNAGGGHSISSSSSNQTMVHRQSSIASWRANRISLILFYGQLAPVG